MTSQQDQGSISQRAEAVSELAATAAAESPRRHALKYRTPLATPQAMDVAAGIATYAETA